MSKILFLFLVKEEEEEEKKIKTNARENNSFPFFYSLSFFFSRCLSLVLFKRIKLKEKIEHRIVSTAHGNRISYCRFLSSNLTRRVWLDCFVGSCVGYCDCDYSLLSFCSIEDFVHHHRHQLEEQMIKISQHQKRKKKKLNVSYR